jgi:inorganic pyrophosphatase
MNLYHSISHHKDFPNQIPVIIEIPKNGRIKYEFDHDHGILAMDRIDKTPFGFPAHYGMVPQTWNDGDNDPLDVLVLCSEEIAPGVLVHVKPLGYLDLIDSGEKDEKIIAVPLGDPVYNEMKNYTDIPQITRDRIVYFYSHYKDMKGKKVEVKEFYDHIAAKKLLEQGYQSYRKKYDIA